MALEWIEARPLAELDASALPEGWATRAAAILDGLHSNGVALGDLHHRDLLIDAAGDVYLIDLATAWVSGSRPGPLRRGIFRRLCELDRLALARMRARADGEDPEQVVERDGSRAAVWHRRGRRVRRMLRRLGLR